MKRQRAVLVFVLAVCLLTPVASQAATRVAEPRSDRFGDVRHEPGGRDRWLRRLPPPVRRFVVSVQEMLVPPTP